MGDNDGASCCNEPQHAFIYLYILYVLIVIITWGTMLAKPMRLLTTAVHEISHALACWITGGQVEAIEVYTNEGGVTRFRGGCRCLINCAGYLGEAFWGMMFVLLSGGRLTSTFAASGLIVALLISLCYSPNRVLVALNIFYAIVTLAFILVEWYVFTPILMYVTLLYGVFFGTYAIVDIFDHLVIRSNPQSDAYAAYEESGGCCYPRCVGVTWLIIAVLFQMIGIWLALILMSDECGDDGWFECVFHSKFDLDLLEFDWWPDDWDLFDQ
jgi:hypothetical protein